MLEEYESSKKLLKAKDDMIYKLLDEKKWKDSLFATELDKATRNELNQWISLVDSYAGELKKY